MSTISEGFKEDFKNVQKNKKNSNLAVGLLIVILLVLVVLPFLGLGLLPFFGILYIANKIYDCLNKLNSKKEEEKAP